MNNLSNRVELEKQDVVETGRSGGSEVARLLERRKVSDFGKMMVLLVGAEADCEDRGISEERLQSYAYILSQKGIVPVGYWFHFSPSPVNGEIEEGFFRMRDIGYVSRDVKRTDVSGFGLFGDKLWLTAKGKEWVNKTLQEDGPSVMAPIQEAIRELNGKSNAELSEECYQASRISK